MFYKVLALFCIYSVDKQQVSYFTEKFSIGKKKCFKIVMGNYRTYFKEFCCNDI